MSSSEEMPEGPFIGPVEQALFGIQDTRERADALKSRLTPKLLDLLEDASEIIRDVYGDGIFEPYVVSLTPAHRKNATKTQEFDIASAGLTVKGQFWFWQLRLECSSTALSTRLFGLRGREANPLIQVLQRHTDRAVELIEHIGCEIVTESIAPGQGSDPLTLHEYIRRCRIMPESEWCQTRLVASELELPLPDPDSAWDTIYDFVALFPIFQAATDILTGHPDRFAELVTLFWNWDSQGSEESEDAPELNPLSPDADVYQEANTSEDDESAIEGEITLAIRRHRHRESRLRNAKVRQALLINHGRLKCEVPGCGFDFYEVYGELGREFAIVHHKSPLSDRTEPELTTLDDLVIVCANCHAMIHRGNDCRPLEGLIGSHT